MNTENSQEQERPNSIALTHHDSLLIQHKYLAETDEKVKGAYESVSSILGDIAANELADIETVEEAQLMVNEAFNAVEEMRLLAGEVAVSADAGIRELKEQRDQIRHELIEYRNAVKDPLWTEHEAVKKMVAGLRKLHFEEFKLEMQNVDQQLMSSLQDNMFLKAQLEEILGTEIKLGVQDRVVE